MAMLWAGVLPSSFSCSPEARARCCKARRREDQLSGKLSGYQELDQAFRLALRCASVVAVPALQGAPS
eukprot:431415-Rhodomonas_salina.1